MSSSSSMKKINAASNDAELENPSILSILCQPNVIEAVSKVLNLLVADEGDPGGEFGVRQFDPDRVCEPPSAQDLAALALRPNAAKLAKEWKLAECLQTQNPDALRMDALTLALGHAGQGVPLATQLVRRLMRLVARPASGALAMAVINRFGCVAETIVERALSPKTAATDALRLAAEIGSPWVARALQLRTLCDPNQLGAPGYTPLHVAANNGCLVAVRTLLEDSRVNPRVKKRHNATVLHTACLSRSAAVVREVLDRVPDLLEEQDVWGRTALFYAASSNDVESMELLLARGANPSIVEFNGLDIVQIATSNGAMETTFALLDSPGPLREKYMNPVELKRLLADSQYGRNPRLIAELRVRLDEMGTFNSAEGPVDPFSDKPFTLAGVDPELVRLPSSVQGRLTPIVDNYLTSLLSKSDLKWALSCVTRHPTVTVKLLMCLRFRYEFQVREGMYTDKAELEKIKEQIQVLASELASKMDLRLLDLNDHVVDRFLFDWAGLGHASALCPAPNDQVVERIRVYFERIAAANDGNPYWMVASALIRLMRCDRRDRAALCQAVHDVAHALALLPQRPGLDQESFLLTHRVRVTIVRALSLQDRRILGLPLQGLLVYLPTIAMVDLPPALSSYAVEQTDVVHVRRLGAGAHGSVHLVDVLGRRYAAKVLQGLSAVTVAREVGALLSLRDRMVGSKQRNSISHIQAITLVSPMCSLWRYLGCCSQSGPEERVLVVMLDYVDGALLKEFVCSSEKELHTSALVYRMLRAVARRLQTLHELNYVHGDLHWGNVIVASDGSQASLVDFGLARDPSIATGAEELLSEVEKLQMPHVFDRVHRVSAPEVFVTGSFSSASDVYSFGVMVWQLLVPVKVASDYLPSDNLAMRGFHPPLCYISDETWQSRLAQIFDEVPEKRPSLKTVLEWLDESIRKCSADESQIPSDIIHGMNSLTSNGRNSSIGVNASPTVDVVESDPYVSDILGAFTKTNIHISNGKNSFPLESGAATKHGESRPSESEMKRKPLEHTVMQKPPKEVHPWPELWKTLCRGDLQRQLPEFLHRALDGSVRPDEAVAILQYGASCHIDLAPLRNVALSGVLTPELAYVAGRAVLLGRAVLYDMNLAIRLLSISQPIGTHARCWLAYARYLDVLQRTTSPTDPEVQQLLETLHKLMVSADPPVVDLQLLSVTSQVLLPNLAGVGLFSVDITTPEEECSPELLGLRMLPVCDSPKIISCIPPLASFERSGSVDALAVLMMPPHSKWLYAQRAAARFHIIGLHHSGAMLQRDRRPDLALSRGFSWGAQLRQPPLAMLAANIARIFGLREPMLQLLRLAEQCPPVARLAKESLAMAQLHSSTCNLRVKELPVIIRELLLLCTKDGGVCWLAAMRKALAPLERLRLDWDWLRQVWHVLPMAAYVDSPWMPYATDGSLAKNAVNEEARTVARILAIRRFGELLPFRHAGSPFNSAHILQEWFSETFGEDLNPLERPLERPHLIFESLKNEEAYLTRREYYEESMRLYAKDGSAAALWILARIGVDLRDRKMALDFSERGVNLCMPGRPQAYMMTNMLEVRAHALLVGLDSTNDEKDSFREHPLEEEHIRFISLPEVEEHVLYSPLLLSQWVYMRMIRHLIRHGRPVECAAEYVEPLVQQGLVFPSPAVTLLLLHALVELGELERARSLLNFLNENEPLPSSAASSEYLLLSGPTRVAALGLCETSPLGLVALGFAAKSHEYLQKAANSGVEELLLDGRVPDDLSLLYETLLGRCSKLTASLDLNGNRRLPPVEFLSFAVALSAPGSESKIELIAFPSLARKFAGLVRLHAAVLELELAPDAILLLKLLESD